MEIEDGVIWVYGIGEACVIWVYGIGEDSTMAFTDFGIENLKDLVRMHKDDPDLLKRPE